MRSFDAKYKVGEEIKRLIGLFKYGQDLTLRSANKMRMSLKPFLTDLLNMKQCIRNMEHYYNDVQMLVKSGVKITPALEKEGDGCYTFQDMGEIHGFIDDAKHGIKQAIEAMQQIASI